MFEKLHNQLIFNQKQNINRLNLEQNLKTEVCDGLEFLKNNTDVFDIIVLDAPCSATGTFRKHPEVMHLKTVQDIKKQIPLQIKMLKEAVDAVKKDGLVLYCTCSISKSEGEKLILRFLQENKDVELLKSDINDINISDGKKLYENIIDRSIDYVIN